MAKNAVTLTVPTKIGKGTAPISVEVSLTRTKPSSSGGNVSKIEIGGEEFYVVAGKTVLK